MTNGQLDKLIAEEVMGWNYAGTGIWTDEHGGAHFASSWRPTVSYSNAMKVLERIADLNKQDDFCRALNVIIKPEEESGLTYAYTWALRMATPRQMMDAALTVVMEKKNEQRPNEVRSNPAH